MHEFSIGSAIVATAVRHADGRRVSAVQVRIGALRQVVPESLDFAFGIVARDTVCAGAELSVERVGARLRCATCTTEWDADVAAFRCPRCASGDVSVLCGEELEVESIEVETEAACTA